MDFIKTSDFFCPLINPQSPVLCTSSTPMSFSIKADPRFDSVRAGSVSTGRISSDATDETTLILNTSDGATSGFALGGGMMNVEANRFSTNSGYLRLNTGGGGTHDGRCGLVCVVGDAATGAVVSTLVSATAESAAADATFTVASGAGFAAGNIVEVAGHNDTINNGLWEVTNVAVNVLTVATAVGPTNPNAALAGWLNNAVKGGTPTYNPVVRKVEIDCIEFPAAAGAPGRRRGSTVTLLTENGAADPTKSGRFGLAAGAPLLRAMEAPVVTPEVATAPSQPDFSAISDPALRREARRAHRRAQLDAMIAKGNASGASPSKEKEEEEEDSSVPEWTKTATVSCKKEEEPFTVVSNNTELEKKVNKLERELREKEKIIGDILARLAVVERKTDRN